MYLIISNIYKDKKINNIKIYYKIFYKSYLYLIIIIVFNDTLFVNYNEYNYFITGLKVNVIK